MYFLIEHEGSKESNLKVKEIINYLEDTWGANTETIVGIDSDNVKIYDENFNLMVRIGNTEKIDEDILTLILRLQDGD